MKKIFRRQFKIKELKRRGFSYQQIGGLIRKMKKDNKIFIPIKEPVYKKTKEVVVEPPPLIIKLTLWQRLKKFLKHCVKSLLKTKT